MYILSLHRFQHATQYKRNRNIILLGSVGGEKNVFFPNVRQLVSDLYLKAHQLLNLAVSS